MGESGGRTDSRGTTLEHVWRFGELDQRVSRWMQSTYMLGRIIQGALNKVLGGGGLVGDLLGDDINRRLRCPSVRSDTETSQYAFQ